MASTDGDSLGNRGAAAGSSSSSLDREGGLASFGERMALVMHKWTWQQLLAAQKGPKCQGMAASEAREAVTASGLFKDGKRSKKVHYADSSQIH